jgi:hypothetical protein
VLTFMPTANAFAPLDLYEVPISGPGGGQWAWESTDRLLSAKLDASTGGGEILLWSLTRTASAVLRRGAGGRLELAWQASKIEPAAGSPAGAWERQLPDRFLAADLDGDGAKEIVIVAPEGRAAVAAWSPDAGRVELRFSAAGRVAPPGPGGASWRLAAATDYLVADIDGDGCDEIVAHAGDGRLGVLRGVARPSTDRLAGLDKLGPSKVGLLTIAPRGSHAELDLRRSLMANAYTENANAAHNFAYLDEAYALVPIELALRLQADGAYTAALDWLAAVYDYARVPGDRRIAPMLTREQSLAPSLERAPQWLLDPLNPHLLAATRPDSYTKFTVLTIVRCLLAHADAEYTIGTAESVPRALALYLKALELLDAPELSRRLGDCSDLIGRITITIGDPELVPVLDEILSTLAHVHDAAALSAAVERVNAALEGDGQLAARLVAARAEAHAARDADARPTIAGVVQRQPRLQAAAEAAALGDPGVFGTAQALGLDRRGLDWRWAPAPAIEFCLPPNPVIEALRSHAALNVAKIRDCRTITGIRAELEPYTPRAQPLQPLPYRYAVLVDRAKQLIQLAAQIEASMLAALIRRNQLSDATAYEQLKARQDLALARAGVRLKDLEVTRALDSVTAAEAQRDLSGMHADHARRLLEDARSPMAQLSELKSWLELAKSGAEDVVAATAVGGSAGGFVAFAAVGFQLWQKVQAYEERVKELERQWELGRQSVRIGESQVAVARDSVAVAEQERAITGLKVDHAEEVLDFLARKFETPELYEWMRALLEDVYRFFLQQATSMARLAEAQLGFERQEVPPAFVQADYWEPPQPPPATAGDRAVRTSGLTGSERLLRDIYELDQYAFRTDQRKLQLTRTISLAQLDPLAFQLLRDTGVLRFRTPMELFDRDFPGQYLRLIRRVRTSVLALVPAPQGIRATLSTTGTSRVVIGGDNFGQVVVQRGPETVALTSPAGATGLFELDAQPQMLAPFEHIGVDATWELALPKPANPFDYATIADVQLTIDYTALASAEYRAQVVERLGSTVHLERPFSFRNDLPDPWYDLHNPDQTATPMSISFRSGREDFMPHADELAIEHVALYFAPADGAPPASWATDLETALAFVPDDGQPFPQRSAKPFQGLITTRPGVGNAQNWQPLASRNPVGQWTLKLPSGAEQVFADEQVADIVFVITYAAELPAWPDA